MNFDRTMRSIQHGVERAGGEWIGIQDSLPSLSSAGGLPLIIFRHPRTKKTLQVSFNLIFVEEEEVFKAVQAQIAEKPVHPSQPISPEYVSVIESQLVKIARNLKELAAEVDALLERKKT